MWDPPPHFSLMGYTHHVLAYRQQTKIGNCTTYARCMNLLQELSVLVVVVVPSRLMNYFSWIFGSYWTTHPLSRTSLCIPHAQHPRYCNDQGPWLQKWSHCQDMCSTAKLLLHAGVPFQKISITQAPLPFEIYVLLCPHLLTNNPVIVSWIISHQTASKVHAWDTSKP